MSTECNDAATIEITHISFALIFLNFISRSPQKSNQSVLSQPLQCLWFRKTMEGLRSSLKLSSRETEIYRIIWKFSENLLNTIRDRLPQLQTTTQRTTTRTTPQPTTLTTTQPPTIAPQQVESTDNMPFMDYEDNLVQGPTTANMVSWKTLWIFDQTNSMV